MTLGPRGEGPPPGRVGAAPGPIHRRYDIRFLQAQADSVALNGLSGSFGNIGRLKNNYQYWTTEYIYTYGHPGGLAAFLGYLSNAVGLDDLASAGYIPCRDPDHPSAARLCARADS